MNEPKTGLGKIRMRQALEVCRLELIRNFAGRRDFVLLLLACLPVGLFGLMLLLPVGSRDPFRNPGIATMMYAAIYQTFILRMVVYFGCVVSFMGLFRGDILDRSLHYYFLTPIRREVLVAGKYLSGLLTTGLLFGASTLASYFLVRARYARVVPSGMGGGPGWDHLFWYLLVTELACVGYGAVFLLMGIRFRNPIVPALVVFGWEWLIFLLPPFLKKVSVAYYLQSLCPVQLMNGPIEIVAEPSPPAIAVPGLLGVTAVALVLAALSARRLEVSYASE